MVNFNKFSFHVLSGTDMAYPSSPRVSIEIEGKKLFSPSRPEGSANISWITSYQLLPVSLRSGCSDLYKEKLTFVYLSIYEEVEKIKIKSGLVTR